MPIYMSWNKDSTSNSVTDWVGSNRPMHLALFIKRVLIGMVPPAQPSLLQATDKLRHPKIEPTQLAPIRTPEICRKIPR